ncbi:MAG TPA: hypothetical protein VMW87_01585 [Spirochaetia bacterium]|nr:hypothetical protein [Spirochaetia bacterium]
MQQAMTDALSVQATAFSTATSGSATGTGSVSWTYNDTGNPISFTVTFHGYTTNGITYDGTIGMTFWYADTSPANGQYDAGESITAMEITAHLSMAGAPVHSLDMSLLLSYSGSIASYSGSITADGSTYTYSQLFS